jgi:hypothetical protein
VSQAGNDKEQLAPMAAAVETNTGAAPATLTADAAYYSESNARECEGRGIDPYLAVGRIKHGAAAAADGDESDLSVKDRMRRKLLTERGRTVYAKRKGTVEPVFGQIKQARGLRQFLLRGLENVAAEWDLWCLSPSYS